MTRRLPPILQQEGQHTVRFEKLVVDEPLDAKTRQFFPIIGGPS